MHFRCNKWVTFQTDKNLSHWDFSANNIWSEIIITMLSKYDKRTKSKSRFVIADVDKRFVLQIISKQSIKRSLICALIATDPGEPV